RRLHPSSKRPPGGHLGPLSDEARHVLRPTPGFFCKETAVPGGAYSPASYAVRAGARLFRGNASGAVGALLAFVIIVFSCIGTVFPALAPFVPAKGVAAVGLLGLFISIVFYRREIETGGWITLGLVTYLGIALASRFWSAWPEMSSSLTGDLIKYVAI